MKQEGLTELQQVRRDSGCACRVQEEHSQLGLPCPTLPPLNCDLCHLVPQMSKALHPVTNPLSHQSLDAPGFTPVTYK